MKAPSPTEHGRMCAALAALMLGGAVVTTNVPSTCFHTCGRVTPHTFAGCEVKMPSERMWPIYGSLAMCTVCGGARWSTVPACKHVNTWLDGVLAGDYER